MASYSARLRAFALEPFRIHGTALDPNLLLMLKLVVVGLLLKGYHNTFPDAFSPFCQFLDVLPEPWFRRGLKLVFLACAAGLLFNRAVRANAFAIGVVFLAGLLASKVYYRNAIVFVAVLFILTSLQERGKAPWLLWCQLGVMYLGAGINKLFEADWRSGHYFDYFLTHIFPSDVYAAISPLLPAGLFAALLCWWIIVAELGAGALFFFPRRHGLAVWLAASVHIGAAFLVIGDYGIYLTAVLASYLCMLKWPGQFRVIANAGRLTTILDGRETFGRKAFWYALAYSPVTYFAGVVFMTVPNEAWRVFAVRTFGVTGIIILFVTACMAIGRFRRARRDYDANNSVRKSTGVGSDSRRVLIFSTLAPFTRNLVWAAGHAGLRCDVVTDAVHVSWSKMSNVGRVIRAPIERIVSCDPALMREVFAQLPPGYRAMLTPGDTRCTRFIHRTADALPAGISLFPMCDAPLFEQLYDKARFAELLGKLALPHPRTWTLHSIEEINGEDFVYPVVAKPANSEGAFEFECLSTRHALEQRLRVLQQSSNMPALVQSFVPGDDIDMSLLADRGRIVAWTIQQRMNDESMRFLEHPDVYEACARLVSATNYHGVMHVDLRIDSRDGRLYLIEANPRFWGSMCYSTWADVNFLELGRKLVFGETVAVPARANLGVYPYLAVTRRTLPQLLLGGRPLPKVLAEHQKRYWRYYHRWGNGGLYSWLGQYLTRAKV